MRLYFDNNVYNRPFDDRRILRNRHEARAVQELLGRIETGEVELVSSFIVEAEHYRLALSARKKEIRALMNLARGYVAPQTAIFERARDLEKAGLAPNDALHFAAAERAGADYFVTCDDKLLRKARRIQSLTKVVLPPELLEEENP